MKVFIKKDFLIHTIANEKVLIGNGEQINFSKMLVLNDTAAFVIAELQKQDAPIALEELAQSLHEHFEVEYDVAFSDVKELLHQLQEQEVVISNAALHITPQEMAQRYYRQRFTEEMPEQMMERFLQAMN